MKKKRIISLLMTAIMFLSVAQPCFTVLASAQSVIELNMSDSAVKGSGGRAECTVNGLTNPVYTWTSDNTDVVEVVGYGATAAVKYKTEGTATVTVSVTGDEGSQTDSVTVTVSGDIVTEWDEEVAAHTYYQLVSAPTNGNDYVIMNANAAGNAMATSVKGMEIKPTSLTINAASEDSGNVVYIDSAQNDSISACVWTCVTVDGNYTFLNNSKNMLAENEKLKYEAASTNKAQWKYSSNNLTSVNNNRSFKVGDKDIKLTDRANEITPVYFYEKTYYPSGTVHRKKVTPTEYSPAAELKYNNADADGERYDIYNTPIGSEIKLDGSYTGYASRGALANAVWASSNPGVATVENGIVTVTGKGLTEITYTVTDGTTTLVKKVILNISQKNRIDETYVLTNTLEADKEYAIVSTKTAGSGAAMTDSLYTSGNITGHDDYAVTVESEDGQIQFCSENERIVFIAEADGNGGIRLKDYYGKYIAVNKVVSGKNTYISFVTVDSPSDAAVVSYPSEGELKFANSDSYRTAYLSSGGYFYPTTSSYNVYLYEKTESDPLVKIKYNGTSVGGTGMTIYSINEYSAVNLAGEYRNFPGDVNVTWSSSDESIATVDQNGFVSFTGEEGDVVITYTVTDKDDDTVRAASSVVFTTTLQKDPKRAFKPTDTITAGKSYVISSTKSIGSAMTMNSHITDSSWIITINGDYHVIQYDDADGSLFIETELDDFSSVWTAEASAVSGYYYLKNKETGGYLYGNRTDKENGVLSLSTLNDKKRNDFSWKLIDGHGLYNASGYFVRFSDGSMYFRTNYDYETTANYYDSNVYLFEETVLQPFAGINSDYVSISGKEVEKTHVCPYQTETLVPVTSNFNTRKLTYVWTSDNDEVATIDPSTGVLTYTGVSGTVNVTLKVVSTIPNEDGSYDTATAVTTLNVSGTDGAGKGVRKYTLTDTFVPGKKYAFASSASSGSHLVMQCRSSGVSSGEVDSYSTKCNFTSNSASTTYFESDDQAIAWECIDAGDGHFYFKSDHGTYLVLHSDSRLELLIQQMLFRDQIPKQEKTTAISTLIFSINMTTQITKCLL